MKKITGFFLALLPIFVILLMFVSGMIVKDLSHVFVSSVEFAQDSVSLQWTIPDEEAQIHPTEQLVTRVLPFNASNPDIEYYSSNPEIVDVDNNGKITAVGFGEADVYAFSKENELLNARCTVEVWDTQIHHIAIKNEIEVNYLGFGQRRTIDAVPVPSTHLEEDPTLHFRKVKDSGSVLKSVEYDGEIIANEYCDEGDATIEVYTSNTQRPVVKQLDVRVGVGVSSIELKDKNDAKITSDKYSLYDDILVYPEKKENMSANDFIYEIDDKNIAEISDAGVVTFHQQGTVSVTATYKRNRELSITKTITSSCNYLSDVAFNRYSYEADISEFATNPFISQEDINWHIYPKIEDSAPITITSTNPDVVSVEENNALQVHKSGSTTLLASVDIAEGITKQDACTVFIYDKTVPISTKTSSVTLDDSYIYNLRDNVDLSTLKTENQHIIWESTGTTDQVEVNNNNETIFFKEPCSVTVTGKVYDDGGSTITRQCSFIISCSYSQSTSIEVVVPTVEEGQTPVINVQAGEKYLIRYSDGVTPLWPSFVGSAKENFYTTSYLEGYWFVPKAGITIDALDLYSDPDLELVPTTTIKLIVEQPATGIYADSHFPFYTTALSELAMPTYIPAYPNTANDEEGNKILPKYEFEYTEGDVFVDENEHIIQFKSPSTVSIKASVGSQTNEYFVKSTFGCVGKFNLIDKSGNIKESGDEIQISPDANEPTILMVNNDSLFASDIIYDSSLADKFNVTSLSGTCDTSIIVDSIDQSIQIKIEPKEKSFGKDTLMIDTGMFTFYLNVNISTDIFDFDLLYKDQLITDSNNTSYINDLMVNILPLPLVSSAVAENQFTIKLNEQDVDVLHGSRALLHLQEGENIVKVSSKNSDYQEEFVINKEDPGEISEFTIAEADSGNNIYINCGSTIAALTIKIDGFVDDDFFTRFDSGISYTPLGHESWKRSFDKIYIRDIVRATNDKPGFENTIDIKLGQNPTKTFKVHRDTISRIEFPHHDNTDFTDLKGLQKVHVYGNKSFYSPQEGEIDYYKLPFNIYNFQGDLITDVATKQKALASLQIILDKPSETTHTWEYDQTNDLIKIKFDQNPEHLYSEQEMYENAFESHTKDVKFSISTLSGFASCSYSFVPVEGRNVYCQEGMTECLGRDGDCRKVVLQTNFGLEGSDKDNVPFDQIVWYKFETIYGNGYTINFNADAEVGGEGEGENNDIMVSNIFNTTIQGCNDKNVKHGADIDLQTWKDNKIDQLFAYNIFKNIPRGLFLYCSPVNKVRNCLFYNNYLVSINVNADNTEKSALYLQDCVMFNCSSAAIDQVFAAEVYFKGFVDVFNFKNQNALVIGDVHFEFLWDVIYDDLKAAHALQEGADGREYINSCMVSVLPGKTYFWDENQQQYVENTHGNPYAANHWKWIAGVGIPGWYEAQIWGTPIPSYDPGSYSYYDEFDHHGNLRWDFLNSKIRKVARPVNPYWMA